MRLHLPRFTVRRLMVAVAIVSVTLGTSSWMKRRARWFQYEATRHLGACIDCLSSSWTDRAAYHRDMLSKYEWAACYPWFPVGPDPTERCCCEPAFGKTIAARVVDDKSCCENHVKPRKGAASCCLPAIDKE
jgi:hypothetical protein